MVVVAVVTASFVVAVVAASFVVAVVAASVVLTVVTVASCRCRRAHPCHAPPAVVVAVVSAAPVLGVGGWGRSRTGKRRGLSGGGGGEGGGWVERR
uniref:Uncharacterized protein n=1 Tax=Oryza barthii TaxID=65489 RepID=A0A0D3HKI7_9ORYZ